MPNLNGCLKLAWVSQNANCVNDMVTVTLWTTNAYFSRSRILVQMKKVSIYVKTGNSLISYSHVNHLKLTRCSIEWKCWLSDLPARFVIVIVDSNLNVVIKKGISHVINIYLSCLCFINFRRPKQLFLLILEDIKQLKLWFSTESFVKMARWQWQEMLNFIYVFRLWRFQKEFRELNSGLVCFFWTRLLVISIEFR